MYSVAGANIFGQWFSDEMIIEGFKKMTAKIPGKNFDLDKAKLIQAVWSYNIFEINGVFYISGSYAGKDRQLVTVPLPREFPKDCITMLVAGNDKYIFMIDAEKQIIFRKDLDRREVDKMIVIEPTEEELEEAERLPKKNKKTNQILKVMTTNNASIFLRFVNRNVQVFAGMIPSYFPDNHIIGRVIDVQCGYEHYVLLTDTGRVYTWGNGSRLQLGHGSIDSVDRPREVRALAGFNIKKIRAGGWHCAVVSEFGDLYMWGWNDVGQLGVKSRSQRRRELRDGPSNKKKKTHPISTVVDIYDDELNAITLDVIDVSCGSKHSVIMLTDYSVWASGSNEYGQLGLPMDDCSHTEHFIKVYQGNKDTVLKCGPWTTVLEN